jgi:hypothetical protein
MLCLQCQKRFYERKTFSNLFSFETHFICESCYQRYPLLPRYQTIPIQGGVMHYHLLIERHRAINPEAYMSFLKPYYLYFLKIQTKHIFLYFDIIDDKIIQTMDLMKLGDLYVVALYENI